MYEMKNTNQWILADSVDLKPIKKAKIEITDRVEIIIQKKMKTDIIFE